MVEVLGENVNTQIDEEEDVDSKDDGTQTENREETQTETTQPDTTQTEVTNPQDEQGESTEPTVIIPPKTYVVKKGDTLETISREQYGDVYHVDEICKLNGLDDGNLIFIGQKLLLP